MIFLFRLLKVDTIFSYDPWGHYEENPDHYVTAQCVEAACWMAAGHLDFPEHFAAGLKPHRVKDKILLCPRAATGKSRGRHLDYYRPKDLRHCANRTMVGNMVRELQSELAQRNLKLPQLEASRAKRSTRTRTLVSRRAARRGRNTASPMRRSFIT